MTYVEAKQKTTKNSTCKKKKKKLEKKNSTCTVREFLGERQRLLLSSLEFNLCQFY